MSAKQKIKPNKNTFGLNQSKNEFLAKLRNQTILFCAEEHVSLNLKQSITFQVLVRNTKEITRLLKWLEGREETNRWGRLAA